MSARVTSLCCSFTYREEGAHIGAVLAVVLLELLQRVEGRHDTVGTLICDTVITGQREGAVRGNLNTNRRNILILKQVSIIFSKHNVIFKWCSL